MILYLNTVFTVTSEEVAGHSTFVHTSYSHSHVFEEDKFTLPFSLPGPQFPDLQQKGCFFAPDFLGGSSCGAGVGFWKGLWFLDIVSICAVSAVVAQQAGALDWHTVRSFLKKKQPTINNRKLTLKPDWLSFLQFANWFSRVYCYSMWPYV